jgi:hypothetical protein
MLTAITDYVILLDMSRANKTKNYWRIRNELMLTIMDAPLGITWGQIINRISSKGLGEYTLIEIFHDLIKEAIVYEQNGYWYI